METTVIHFIILGVIADLTKGAGVLPDVLNAAVGETVMFNTTLNPPEKPFLTVGWTFDEKDIIVFSGTNITAPEYEGRITLFMSTGSLELRNVALNDSGVYRVNIFPSGEPQKTGETRLNVDVPVSNVMATASSTDLVEFNSSVRLSCSASGSSLSFLWLNGSSVVTASDRVQLTDGGATLTIVSVTRYDQGPFRCVFNPVSDGTSDPINLSISYGPDNVILTVSPSQEYHAEGSNIDLMCSADSRPAAQFMWLLHGVLLSHTGPELRLMNIQDSQSGNYSCQAFNNKTLRYESSPPATISVLTERISGASITSSTYMPIEGNSVNLTCDAAGSVFTRKWMKDGSDLVLSDNMILNDKNRVLSFKSLNKEDSGEYSCTVSNPVSSDEAKYSMEVNYGPENVQITGPSQIHLNENLTLTCSAESTPSAIIYFWTLNGTGMLNGRAIHNFSVFTKENTEPFDSGIYTCVALNYVTWKISSADHELSVTVSDGRSGGLSPGAIAGIVISVLVVVSAAAAGGHCICKNKVKNKAPPPSDNKEKEEQAYENTSVVYEST